MICVCEVKPVVLGASSGWHVHDFILTNIGIIGMK